MGTRRKSWIPRRDRDAHLPSRDRDVGFTSRDETFVALETWSRRYSTSFTDCNNRPRCYLSRSLF